jgi:hypothetical protein
MRGGSIGPLALGLTRAGAAARLPPLGSAGRGFSDYCLALGPGIRVAYTPLKLLRRLRPATRTALRGRIVLALTANSYYSLNTIRPGAAAAGFTLGRGFRVGLSQWYLLPGAASATGIVEVRNGKIAEVGVVDRRLAPNARAGRILLTTLSSSANT